MRGGRGLAGVAGLAAVGAALLVVVARRYPIDAPGACCVQHRLGPYLPYGAIFLAGIACLTVAWLLSARLETTRARVLCGGAVVHAVALVGKPFLSLDPLYYTAIGRTLARGGSALRPLGETLGSDPLVALLPPGWRLGTTPYLAGFNRLGEAIARVAGGRLAVELHLYQLVGLLAMVGSAALVGRAVRDRADEAEAARAAALVLFCPLALVEGTLGGHNDALLALGVAAFALATVRRRPLLALAALGSGLLIKASALLLLGMEAARLALARLRRFVTPGRVLFAGVLLGAGAVAAVLLLRDRSATVGSAAALVGSPTDAFEHCTRSAECLPRALLRYLFHADRAAWLVGLVFRAASAVWLCYAAARAAREAEPLAWLATGLFIYYLLFHGYMQSWYLLSLVPLLPFADRRLLPVMKLFCVTLVAYYAIDLPLSNATTAIQAGGREVGEAVVANGIPLFTLLGMQLRGRAR